MARPSTEMLLEDLEELDDDAPSGPTPKTDNEIEDAYANVSFRVIYQSNNFFLPQIRDLVNSKEIINLRPEYQRRLRWSNKKKSLLIESLLLNIPVPPIFLFESTLARYEVMDGQQRLNAIHEYLENNFPLIGLDKLNFLRGRRYAKLPPKLQRGLDRASIGAIVLLQETKSDVSDPYLVRRYVFERLNTGGEKLNPQEIRNSIFRGPFNDMIVNLARNNTFCRIFGIPEYTETDTNEYYENPDRQKNTLYRKMNDCQIVLRYFALLKDDHIRGSMRSILDGCMKRNQNASPQIVEECARLFIQSIEACDAIFKGDAFLLPPDTSGKQRQSVALYDSLMVGLYRNRTNIESLLERKTKIRAKVETTIKHNAALFTAKANTAQSIKDRISKISAILGNPL